MSKRTFQPHSRRRKKVHGFRARMKTYEGGVVISGINPQLYRVFKITHLDRIFEFFPDRSSAVKSVGTG